MERSIKVKWCLIGCLIVVLLFAAVSVFVPDRLAGTVRWLANSNSASELRELTRQEVIPEDSLINMVVDGIGIEEVSYQPVLILKQLEGETCLPILIGTAEATAIGVILEGIDVPRPLTHDLLGSVIESMGARVNHVVVDDFRGQLFYAYVVLCADWQQLKIDARPSDAIALALRVGAPVYVNRAVLDKAGILPEHELDEYTVRYF
jgi:bifunctional DNase/RNase